MARARLLKPGFFTNAALSRIPPHGRLLFAGLWTIADKQGRLKDDALVIKGALFPYEDVDVEPLLQALGRARFVHRYRFEGTRYIQIVTWEKHQHPHINEIESIIPPAQKQTRTLSKGTSATANGASATANGGMTRAEAKAVYGSESGVIDPEAEAAAAAVILDPVAEECRRLCRNVFGSTSTMSKEIERAIARYGPECVYHCVREGVVSGGASWKYAEEIMKRHEQDGCDEAGLTRITKLGTRA